MIDSVLGWWSLSFGTESAMFFFVYVKSGGGTIMACCYFEDTCTSDKHTVAYPSRTLHPSQPAHSLPIDRTNRYATPVLFFFWRVICNSIMSCTRHNNTAALLLLQLYWVYVIVSLLLNLLNLLTCLSVQLCTTALHPLPTYPYHWHIIGDPDSPQPLADFPAKGYHYHYSTIATLISVSTFIHCVHNTQCG